MTTHIRTTFLFIIILDDGSASDCTPESDSTPHINVGNQYQCSSIPDYQPGKEKDDGQVTEHLLWNPEVNYLCTDNEGIK